MVRVEIARRSDGTLRHVKASGHSGFGPIGRDVVCAAATVLLRTAARTLDGATGINIVGGAEEPGNFEFSLEEVPARQEDWARGVSDSLVCGLMDLRAEFPHSVEILIKTEQGVQRNGT